jgi:zinc protease
MAAAPVIFGGTPFGHEADGTPQSLKKLTPADLAQAHAAWFRPDNAILVFTGDLTPEQGFALAEAAFGDWPKPQAPLAPPPAIRPDAAPRAIAIDLPGTGQAAVTVVKPGISRGDPDYYPGIVANTVLGGGYSARLIEEIRIKRGLSYGASSRLSTNLTTGAFRAAAQTRNDAAPQVLELIETEMSKLAAAPADPEELKARKSVLVGSYGRALATTDGLAGILGDLALYGIPLDEITRYTAKVDAVTAPQVQAFAARVLSPKGASVIVAGDAKAFAAGLKAKLTDLQVIPAAEIDFDSPSLRRPAP